MQRMIKDRTTAAQRQHLRLMARRLKGGLLRGNQVECPCCGRRYRRFLYFGHPPRRNALCPHCGALERHRLLWLYLEQRPVLLQQVRYLLHVAPEPPLSTNLRRFAHLMPITADLNQAHVDTRCDLQCLPFATNSFDAILCLHVFEHVLDDRRAMQELYRVLKVGGWAILQVPIHRQTTFEDPSVQSPTERLRLFGQVDHVRVYGLDYYERLERTGFAVTRDDFVRTLPPAQVQRHALMPDETITLCRKQCPVLT